VVMAEAVNPIYMQDKNAPPPCIPCIPCIPAEGVANTNPYDVGGNHTGAPAANTFPSNGGTGPLGTGTIGTPFSTAAREDRGLVAPWIGGPGVSVHCV
jgi:hypothetical protein